MPETTFKGAAGPIAVDMFFILTGFVLCEGYGNGFPEGLNGYGRYIKRRLWAILPVLILVFAYVAIQQRNNIEEYGQWLFINITGLKMFGAGYENGLFFKGNSPDWFIHDIIWMYLLFPFLLKLLKANYKVFVILTAVLLFTTIATGWINPFGSESEAKLYLYFMPFARVPELCIGMLIWNYLVPRRKVQKVNNLWQTVTMLALLTIYIGFTGIYGLKLTALQEVTYWILPNCLLLISLISWYGPNNLIVRGLKSKIMIYLGGMSMVLYMLHAPVSATMEFKLQQMGIEEIPWLIFAVQLVVIFIVGYFVNRYLVGFINRRFR